MLYFTVFFGAAVFCFGADVFRFCLVDFGFDVAVGAVTVDIPSPANAVAVSADAGVATDVAFGGSSGCATEGGEGPSSDR
jgi:hypothetical protein